MTIGVFFIMFPYSVNSAGGLATVFTSVPESHLSLTNIGWGKSLSILSTICLWINGFSRHLAAGIYREKSKGYEK